MTSCLQTISCVYRKASRKKRSNEINEKFKRKKAFPTANACSFFLYIPRHSCRPYSIWRIMRFLPDPTVHGKAPLDVIWIYEKNLAIDQPIIFGSKNCVRRSVYRLRNVEYCRGYKDHPSSIFDCRMSAKLHTQFQTLYAYYWNPLKGNDYHVLDAIGGSWRFFPRLASMGW